MVMDEWKGDGMTVANRAFTAEIIKVAHSII
jgi:hypothetical protein